MKNEALRVLASLDSWKREGDYLYSGGPDFWKWDNYKIECPIDFARAALDKE